MYLIFWGEILKGIVFLYSFSNISLIVCRNATDFWMLIYILLLCRICWSVWVVFGFSPQGFLYIVSLHRVTVLPLFFLFGCLLLLLFVWLLWLGLSELCWITVVRVDIIVLFHILVGRLSAFLHWVLYLLWVCHKLLWLC